jgi:hypothetical protein
MAVDCAAALRPARRRHESTPAIAGKPTTFRAEVRERAMRAFAAEHPDLRLAPVAVVIAALDEEEALPTVLREVPDEA